MPAKGTRTAVDDRLTPFKSESQASGPGASSIPSSKTSTLEGGINNGSGLKTTGLKDLSNRSRSTDKDQLSNLSTPTTVLTPSSDESLSPLSSQFVNHLDFKTNIDAQDVKKLVEQCLVLEKAVVPPAQSITTIPEDQSLELPTHEPNPTPSPGVNTPVTNASSLDVPDNILLDSASLSDSTSSLRVATWTTNTAGRSRSGSLSQKEEKPVFNKSNLPVLPRAHFAANRTLSTPVGLKRSKSTPKVLGAVTKGTSYFVPPAPISVPLSNQSTTLGKQEQNVSNDPMGSTSTTPSQKETSTIAPLSFQDYLLLSLSARGTPRQDLASAELRIERLINFLSLPPYLESSLWFGSFACLDGWLWNFTILPLRFLRALWVIGLFIMKFIGETIANTARSYLRPGYVLERLRTRVDPSSDLGKKRLEQLKRRRKTSSLMPSHKADLLKGLVLFFSCWVLMSFDSSRMYHGIRGQSAIKLYVIFSVLEVADKLCAAVGQDIFECLFSRESLERRPDGTSKLLRPFGFFLLALGFNIIHSTVLFYQVITLNVAVNSYSNALLTLLLSNQFVEIKSTVFKRFEKENLFQITCADIVERFQLWLMLIIIASRNLVEIGLEGFLGVGGFGLTGLVSAGLGFSPLTTSSNATSSFSTGGKILPRSFTIFPKWTGQLMGPFVLVLGSEMLVDWLKHAYITKFNNINPKIYSRFLDVLAKDYYTNAFLEENLTIRLGLPVMPLACLFIRTSLQTYNMFIATQLPMPLPSTETALTPAKSSPAITAALHRFDTLLRRAFLGSSYTGVYTSSSSSSSSASSSSSSSSPSDSAITILTITSFFLGVWLILLACKLVLGILLLGFSRRRYKGMKEREKMSYDIIGRKPGSWVEVSDDQRKWIFMGDEKGGKAAEKRDVQGQMPKQAVPLGEVSRYNMVAKRIW